ncbi:hypothetical protein BJV77DRAFT_1023918 [Russula vinacea]|nr:hypothetical protein BJV77DRAFT_1023918 [Russula vinacea]
MVYIPFAASFASLDCLITGVDYVDPRTGGGSLLDHDSGSGLGEPLNVIISGLSDPAVLADKGFLHFVNGSDCERIVDSVSGIECLGGHLGAPQTANLGDGRGLWESDIGSCLETLFGGNHLRYWHQTGPKANTGALFLAYNLHNKHTIAKNGYNLGRDELVNSAVALKKYKGVKYNTVAQRITGLIPPGAGGINHNISTDGVVVLLTVKIEK